MHVFSPNTFSSQRVESTDRKCQLFMKVFKTEKCKLYNTKAAVLIMGYESLIWKWEILHALKRDTVLFLFQLVLSVSLAVQIRFSWSSLCSPGRTETKESPASVSWGLRLQVYITNLNKYEKNVLLTRYHIWLHVIPQPHVSTLNNNVL